MSQTPKLILANKHPIKGVLIDISGTIYVGDEAIPGAISACRELFKYKDQIKVLFLTNTSMVSSDTLLNQLRGMGFDESCIPHQDFIVTSISSTRQYLMDNGLRPYCLVEDDLIKTDLKGMDMEDPNCVLVGLAPSKFDYRRLNDAFRLLNRLKEESAYAQPDTEIPNLIAIHCAKYYRDEDRNLSLGPGGFVSLLEQTVGTKAHVVGKPSRAFYDAAVSSLGVESCNCVMIGDDAVGDIKGALEAGLGAAILVKTGKYNHGDEHVDKTEGVTPTLTLPSITEAVESIIESIKDEHK